MIYPELFQPTETEYFNIQGQAINISKCTVTFDKWAGESVKETFGGKPILNFNGHPMFAELAIMLTFQNDGWETRWVETYGKKEPICLTNWKDDKYRNQVHQPFQDNEIIKLLADISKLNANTYSGCWDVVAKKGEHIIFVESKRAKKDSIRLSQVNWLSSALLYGLKPDNFLMVQWDFK